MGVPLIPLDPLPVAGYFWHLKPESLRSAFTHLAQRATEGRRRRMAADMLDGVSVLVIPGTGVIDDFGQGPLDLPTHLDRWTFSAAQRDIPCCFLSVGVSNVSNKLSRSLFCRSLARAYSFSVRDATSARNAKVLGHDSNPVVVSDLAFSLPPEWLLTSTLGKPRRVVGIGVMGYFGWNRSKIEGERIYRCYLDKLCSIIASVRTDGYDVRLLTGDARADDATVRDILNRCGGEKQSWGRVIADPIINFRDVLHQIGQCDLVVATRFHNVLFSILLKRPTISIGYCDKNDAVMAYFGLQRFCHDIDNFEVEAVLQHIHQIERYPQDALDGVPPRLVDARAHLDAQYDQCCYQWSEY